MGVFLCIGYNYHNIDIHSYKNVDDLEKINVNSSIIDNIQNYLENIDDKLYLFLGKDNHKIKKKAEQSACLNALKILDPIYKTY